MAVLRSSPDHKEAKSDDLPMQIVEDDRRSVVGAVFWARDRCCRSDCPVSRAGPSKDPLGASLPAGTLPLHRRAVQGSRDRARRGSVDLAAAGKKKPQRSTSPSIKLSGSCLSVADLLLPVERRLMRANSGLVCNVRFRLPVAVGDGGFAAGGD